MQVVRASARTTQNERVVYVPGLLCRQPRSTGRLALSGQPLHPSALTRADDPMARSVKQIASQLKAARASAAGRRRTANRKSRDASAKRAFAEHSDAMKLHDSRRATALRNLRGK